MVSRGLTVITHQTVKRLVILQSRLASYILPEKIDMARKLKLWKLTKTRLQDS